VSIYIDKQHSREKKTFPWFNDFLCIFSNIMMCNEHLPEGREKILDKYSWAIFEYCPRYETSYIQRGWTEKEPFEYQGGCYFPFQLVHILAQCSPK